MSASARRGNSLLCQVALTVCGEKGVVAVIQSFFDESFEDDQSFFAVAGYLFQTSKLRKFERAWRSMLGGLPYFHMQEINQIKSQPNGLQIGGVYDGMTADDADRLARKAIGLIGEFASHGYIIHVDPREVAANWQHTSIINGPYEACLWNALCAAKLWRDEHRPRAGLAYFFEHGGPNQKRAEKTITRLFNDDKEIFGSATKAFVPKGCSPAIDAADILCFLALAEFRRQRRKSKKPARKDFFALVNSVPTQHAKLDMKLWNDRCIATANGRLPSQ